MPTSNAEELGFFLKCTVIGRGFFGHCTCCNGHNPVQGVPYTKRLMYVGYSHMDLACAQTDMTENITFVHLC